MTTIYERIPPAGMPAALSANGLLNRLAPSDGDRVLQNARWRSFGRGDSVWERGQRISSVVFPRSGLFSVLVVMEDGRAVESGMAGREGMIGIPVYLGSDVSHHTRVTCQIPSDALVVGVNEFRDVAQRSAAFRRILDRYTQARLAMAEQTVGCNTLHTIQQRLARWLLDCRERVHPDDLQLTQEFLAIMLGVRRASVSEAARPLQDNGLIRYSRGVITIVDPEGLERVSCECFRVNKMTLDDGLQSS